MPDTSPYAADRRTRCRRQCDHDLHELNAKVDRLTAALSNMQMLIVRGKTAVWVIGALGGVVTWFLTFGPSIRNGIKSWLS